MATTITRDVLEAYLACRYKGHLKLAGERGDKCDYELLMAESRGRVRLAATEKLLAGHTEDEVPRGCTATPELLGRGLPLLLDVTVEGDGLAVRFDALQRADGKSNLGDFHYLPVVFHEGEKAGREQRMLLELLGLILAEVQGKEPGWGVLIHGRGCQARRIKLGPGVGRARRMLQAIREVQGTGTQPQLMLNSHCQVCEFRRRCHAEATAKDDLSLLRGMGAKELQKYSRRGIATVTQLSCTFRPPRRRKKAQDRKVTHSHALQALSVRETKVHVLGTPALPVSPKRIYLDIEGDPDRGFCYLAGALVCDGGAGERHSCWIDFSADEPELLGRVLDIASRHPDAWLFAYGSYEAAFLRRVGHATGREEEVARLLLRTLNVLAVVYNHVYFPTYSNGLKDIAAYLGFRWSEPDASGVQSLVWRRRWEQTGATALKEILTTYNSEDCEALRRVTEFLYAVCTRPLAAGEQPAEVGGHDVARVEDVGPVSSRREWCRAEFAVPDFAFINERAYFDYQRDRVYVRTNRAIRQSRARARKRKGKKNLRPNQRLEINTGQCPDCGCTEVTRQPDGRLARVGYDLRITRSGIRRWVLRFTTSWHRCAACRKRFLPRDYLRLEEHFHSLKSWAMYEYVAHRTSLGNIAETIRDCFGLPIHTADVFHFKESLARYYEGTYQRLLEKLRTGALLHADETEVHLRKAGRGYVWVFTNLEEVVFLYRPSREGDFLKELLRDFRGVLVSDFYAAYDSLDCPQQKCLIHLVRDFNQDIQANPWDEELRSLARDFGSLLRSVVATVDQHGLQRRHLGKHQRDVDRFFDSLAGRLFRSEIAEGYRTRLLKCRGKLFTFLAHDGVPWNNNAAEHAVKQFANYREHVDGQVSEAGLKEYLVLLSVRLTCKYKGVSFLRFLLSGETDIDAFCTNRGRKRPPAAVETHPEGVPLPHPNRQQTWDREFPREQT